MSFGVRGLIIKNKYLNIITCIIISYLFKLIYFYGSITIIQIIIVTFLRLLVYNRAPHKRKVYYNLYYMFHCVIKYYII